MALDLTTPVLCEERRCPLGGVFFMVWGWYPVDALHEPKGLGEEDVWHW